MLSTLGARLGFPSIGPHRRFVTAIAVDAVGSGVFMPVTILYFLAVTPLTLVEIGAAISIASAVAMPAGPVIGAWVDRIGAKRMLLLGNLLQAAGFLAYLVTESFWPVVVWTAVVAVGRTAFWGSYGNIVAVISAPGERERWFGFLGALRNVGFAIGGVASGVAVAIGTDLAFLIVVALNAASYVASFWLLLAVPDVHGEARASNTPIEAPTGSWMTVLRDRPYRLLVVAQIGYAMPMMVLNVALPVYLVEVLDLPGWITGAIFTINCLMVGFGQGLVVNAMTGRVRWRLLVVTQLVFAASYAGFWALAALPVWAAVGLSVLAGMVYTLAELTGGPVHAALSAEAAPEHLRGRYLSLIQLSWNLSSTVAPVAFAWLLAQGAAPLWLALLLLTVVSAGVCAAAGRRVPLAAERVNMPAAVRSTG